MWDLIPWPGIEPRPPALGVLATGVPGKSLDRIYWVSTVRRHRPCPQEAHRLVGGEKTKTLTKKERSMKQEKCQEGDHLSAETWVTGWSRQTWEAGREGRRLAVLEAEQRTGGCWYKIHRTKIHLEGWGGARAVAALRKPLRWAAAPHGSPTAACPPEAGQHQSRLLSDLGKRQSTCAKNDLSNKQSITCYREDGGGRLSCSSVMGESWPVTEGHNGWLPAWSRIQGLCVILPCTRGQMVGASSVPNPPGGTSLKMSPASASYREMCSSSSFLTLTSRPRRKLIRS